MEEPLLDKNASTHLIARLLRWLGLRWMRESSDSECPIAVIRCIRNRRNQNADLAEPLGSIDYM